MAAWLCVLVGTYEVWIKGCPKQRPSRRTKKNASEVVVQIKEIVALSKTLTDSTKENGMSMDSFWGTRSSRGIFEVKSRHCGMRGIKKWNMEWRRWLWHLNFRYWIIE
jgi:hypothetical protein